jgi:hypothetical protein
VWWCGGGVVLFLPIIISHQPSFLVFFCVVGWVVANCVDRSRKIQIYCPRGFILTYFDIAVDLTIFQGTRK